MAKIYVASSWRNPYQPVVVDSLRKAGHEIFDFQTPWMGYEAFQWSCISPDWQNGELDEYQEGLCHPISKEKFEHYFEAMHWADVCVLVLPCDRSTRVDACWFAGSGEEFVVFISR